MSLPPIKITVGVPQIEATQDLHPPVKTGAKTPLAWQQYASDFCLEEENQYTGIHAAGGSGKTTFAIYHSIAIKETKKELRKFVFLAPMTTICASYAKENEFMYKGKSKEWEADRFGSDKEVTHGELSSATFLRKVLFNKSGPIVSVAVTHQGWIQFWKKLNPKEKERLLQNIVIYVDECHHCKPTDKKRRPTELGLFIKEVLEIDNSSCTLILMTATWFRGDGKDIIPRIFEKRFSHYLLPYEEYMKILGIKHFNFDYAAYDKDPLPLIIKAIKRHKDKCHIIVLPPTTNTENQTFRNGKTLGIYMEQLKPLFKPGRILDLITPETQEENKKLLIKNPKDYDLVIACRLMVEGTDWPPAAVVHNTSFKKSPLMYYQITARLFRRYKGKDEIWSYTYLDRTIFEGNAREVFTDRLNILLLNMLMAGHLEPIQIPLLPRANLQKNHGRKKASLMEIMGKEYYDEFMQDIIKEYDFIDSNLRDRSKEIMYKKIKKLTEARYKKDEFLRENVSLNDLKAAAVGYFFRAFLIVKGNDGSERKKLNIAFLRKEGSFDKIWKKTGVDSIGSLVLGTKEPIDDGQMRHLLKKYDENKETRRREFESWGELAVEKSEKETEAKRAFNEIKLTEPKPRAKKDENVIGKWVKFTVPHKWKPDGKSIEGSSEQYGLVTVQMKNEITINFYKDKIVVENNQIVLKGSKKDYVFIEGNKGNYWKVPHSKPPSFETSKKFRGLYLFENPSDLYCSGRKLVKKIQVKIPVDWITETLNI